MESLKCIAQKGGWRWREKKKGKGRDGEKGVWNTIEFDRRYMEGVGNMEREKRAAVVVEVVMVLEKQKGRSETRRVVATHLLLNLKLVHDGRELGEDLVCLLVVLELGGNEFGKVAERLGGVEDLSGERGLEIRLHLKTRHFLMERASEAYILHDANGLFSLANKLVLGLLDPGAGLFAQLLLQAVLATGGLAGEFEGAALCVGLCGIEVESRVLDGLAGAGGKHDVGVEGGAPASQEPALDGGVLGEPGLSDLLAGKGVLLEGCSQRVLASAGVLARQSV